MNSNKALTSNKKDGILPLIICIICFIIAGIAIYHIATTKHEYRIAASEYNELYESMPLRDKQYHPGDIQNTLTERSKSQTASDQLMAYRLQEISHMYQDIIGWIDFDTVSISYPLLHGNTNSDYLRTTFKGTAATAGSIFIESLNSADFSDMHTIIYGHNMKDGSMFGQLKKYESSDFLESNKFFTIYTPEGEEYRYEIISCMVVPLDSDIYTISFEDEDEYKCFLQTMGYEGDDAPQSVTLSTCAGSDKSYRRVVNAVRIAPTD